VKRSPAGVASKGAPAASRNISQLKIASRAGRSRNSRPMTGAAFETLARGAHSGWCLFHELRFADPPYCGLSRLLLSADLTMSRRGRGRASE
jgi:hypothetical protein